MCRPLLVCTGRLGRLGQRAHLWLACPLARLRGVDELRAVLRGDHTGVRLNACSLKQRLPAGVDRDMAIVLVEQFYDFAAELADQYIVMKRGEIVQRGRGENMQTEGARALMLI